ncbi:MAG: hypothetical protein P4L34_02300 [Paludibacter sp.]|nr:hypothetical protein [Paludibacter sp.]
MKNRMALFVGVIMFFLFGDMGCVDEKIAIQRMDGYIIGYDPCTRQQHSKIGYIIVSVNLNDTVITYNISDATYKMPASILSQIGDTLYRIPENYFESFTYFPTITRNDFKVHITYRYPKQNESYSSPCLALYLSGQPHREIITVSITK